MKIFMDIDGVLANIDHRLRYQKEKDYDRFYSPEELSKDTAIPMGIRMLEDFWELERIIYVTGRPERTRDATKRFLAKEAIDSPIAENLLMRKDGDHRPSDVIKIELIGQALREGEEAIFIDDDPKNVIAVEKAFPRVTGIIFSARRLKNY